MHAHSTSRHSRRRLIGTARTTRPPADSVDVGLAVAFIVRVLFEQRCVVLELVIKFTVAVAIVFEPILWRIAGIGAAVLQSFPDDLQITRGQWFSFRIAVIVENRVALGVNDRLGLRAGANPTSVCP